MNSKTESKKVHLVLGAGGARGISHIGVIDELEENGYEIISVTGCSMGAVVGGMYAAGYHSAYRDWMLGLTRAKLFTVLDFTIARQGFLKGEKIFSVLKEFTGVQDIEKFGIPFTAIAADMLHNREIVYTSGDLYTALRASIGIPGVFTPIIADGMFLVDGGVLNPLPLNRVKKQNGERVMAVHLNAQSPTQHTMKESEEENRLLKNIMAWLNIETNEEEAKPFDGEPVSDYSLRELLLSTYNMTQDRLADLMLRLYPPDILVEIPRNTCSTFEFYKAQSLMELGRSKCREAIAGLQK